MLLQATCQILKSYQAAALEDVFAEFRIRQAAGESLASLDPVLQRAERHGASFLRLPGHEKTFHKDVLALAYMASLTRRPGQGALPGRRVSSASTPTSPMPSRCSRSGHDPPTGALPTTTPKRTPTSFTRQKEASDGPTPPCRPPADHFDSSHPSPIPPSR